MTSVQLVMTTAKGDEGDSELSANHRSATTQGRSRGQAVAIYELWQRARGRPPHQAAVRGEQATHCYEIEVEALTTQKVRKM